MVETNLSDQGGRPKRQRQKCSGYQVETLKATNPDQSDGSVAPFEISPKYTCEMNWSRIPIFSISIIAVVVFLLLPFLTMEFLNIKLKHNHVVPRAEAGDLVIVESGLPSRPQQSAAELKARFLEQKLIDRSNQKILLEENAQRLKQILKESETSVSASIGCHYHVSLPKPSAWLNVTKTRITVDIV